MPDEEYDQSVELAKLAYNAYGDAVDFKNYQGLPMPSWDDLGDAIQGAWVAAAERVADELSGPEAAD